MKHLSVSAFTLCRPLCVSALLLAGAAGLSAMTRVVAKTNGDYTTIQAAVTASLAGDTLLVRAGIYNEAVVIGKSGTVANPLTLLAESGAILDGTGKRQVGFSITGKSNIRIIGFLIRNFISSGTPMGISVEGACANIEIRNNHISHIENANGNAHGIGVYGTAATPVSGLVVDGNEIDSCKLGQSESMVLNGNVTDFVVSNNRIHDNDNIGIDFIGYETTGPVGADQANNGLCVGNRVYNISSANNPTYTDRCADGIYVDGGRDIIIEQNVVDNCDIGIEVASEHGGKTTSNILVRNNFVSRSYQGNIVCGGYGASRGNASGIVIVHNTLYQGLSGEVVLQYNCSNFLIKNNVCYAKAGGGYVLNSGSNNSGIVVDNNLYFGAGTSSAGAWTDAHARFGNPLLVLPPSNLHLSAGSPAIGHGLALAGDTAGIADIDGQARIMSGSIDIGADEFDSLTTGVSTAGRAIKTRARLWAFPFSGQQLRVYAVPEAPSQITVYDLAGRRVQAPVIQKYRTFLQLDISGLASGRYLVRARVNGKMLAAPLSLAR